MTGFLTLNDLVLPPPLPAIVSSMLVAGAGGLSETGLRRLRPGADIIRRAAAFVVVVGLLGALVHGLALAHWSSVLVLRILAAMLALCAPLAWPAIKGLPRPRGAGMVLVFVTIGCLALAALGPVTDPDSLDYHLGVPLDWLRHDGVVFEPHWLHARLVGLGEAVNMLGLASGTDGLGALLQVSGLVILVAALGSLGATPRDRLFGMLLALPPVVVPLATAQKPQLLPVSAVVVATILARTAESGVDFALVFGCIGFAMACKHSFLVSGGVVFLAAMYWAWEKGHASVASRWAAGAIGVLVVPVLVRNFHLYGDPVSPFLEAFRSAPDRETLRFAGYLEGAGATHTLAGVGDFLRGLVVPPGVGDVQTVLGIGVLCVLIAAVAGWRGVALGGGVTVLVFTIWRGQMAARFLLEPYYWCAAAATAGQWGRVKSVMFYGVAAQTVGVAAMAAVGAFVLLPGGLTPGLRDWVMRRATYGYEEALWMDRVLPVGETIMVESRAYALFPRPFVIPECAACEGERVAFEPSGFDSVNGLRELVLVRQSAVQGTPPGTCALSPMGVAEHFTLATRNPFGSGRDVSSATMIRVFCP